MLGGKGSTGKLEKGKTGKREKGRTQTQYHKTRSRTEPASPISQNACRHGGVAILIVLRATEASANKQTWHRSRKYQILQLKRQNSLSPVKQKTPSCCGIQGQCGEEIKSKQAKSTTELIAHDVIEKVVRQDIRPATGPLAPFVIEKLLQQEAKPVTGPLAHFGKEKLVRQEAMPVTGPLAHFVIEKLMRQEAMAVAGILAHFVVGKLVRQEAMPVTGPLAIFVIEKLVRQEAMPVTGPLAIFVIEKLLQQEDLRLERPPSSLGVCGVFQLNTTDGEIFSGVRAEWLATNSVTHYSDTPVNKKWTYCAGLWHVFTQAHL
ncbi:hypothetical protein PoB_001532800 [Plakobranchus ocellatus]|uniref:Uncharacterized protein n=1 Tax=Plakobranchus ocellatus TaxID=259542 RepID=A0AAV3Z2U8_9GAST|nr:hypothetical protein PoB_001532800 [Plakobranchus ocellatus]